MRWQVLAALVAFVGLTAFAPAPFLPKKKGPPVRLEGLWEMLPDHEGRSKDTAKYNILIEPGKWTFETVGGRGRGKGGKVAYFLSYDDKASPPTFDLRRAEKDPQPYGRGVYEIKGKQLRITYSFDGFRPEKVDTLKGGIFRMTLRRMK
jgi:uncharacterized protein (TIGR03067 family)